MTIEKHRKKRMLEHEDHALAGSPLERHSSDRPVTTQKRRYHPLYGYKNSNFGRAEVYVHDVFKASIDCYSSSVRVEQLLYESPPLGSGAHKIKARVAGSKNVSSSGAYVSIDAFSSAPIPAAMANAINYYVSTGIAQ